MLRGILKGLFLGGVVGFVAVSALSLLSPLPASIETQSESDLAQSDPAAPASQQLEGTSTTDAPVEAASVAQSPAPAQPVDAAPNADQTSAPKPDAAEVADGQSAPNAAESGGVQVGQVEPVLPNPQSQPITAPSAESELSISVDPAQPPSPADVEAQPFAAPDVADAPEAPATTEAPQVTAETPQTNTEVTADQAPLPQDSPAAPQQLEPEETASLLKPATDLKSRFEQRTSNRLPRIGDAETAPTPESSTEAAAPVLDAMPLKSFAAEFDNLQNKPLMSVVLLDDPASEVDVATLSGFPLPLSVAIDAAKADAADRMALYRGMGLEVLALIDLPAGATASDVEVNFTAQLAAVPEAVAVLEGLSDGLQETREVSEQVIAFALESGHGLVMQPKGLNTAQKLAAREGVPSLSVFRDFDGKGQTEVVMRRFLDQAAFKARQTNGVIMMGRLQPETISALASWALQDRASTVAVAPVSAVLTAP